MEQPLRQCLSTNSVPCAFSQRVAIGCRLSLKIDRKLSPFRAGTLSMVTWYDSAWIGGTASGWIFIQICGNKDRSESGETLVCRILVMWWNSCSWVISSDWLKWWLSTYQTSLCRLLIGRDVLVMSVVAESWRPSGFVRWVAKQHRGERWATIRSVEFAACQPHQQPSEVMSPLLPL